MSHPAWMTLFLQLGVMLLIGVASGQLARRVGLPTLFGELLGGVVLGPTVFGALAPGLHAALFPPGGPVPTATSAIVNLGMLLFLFTAGLEVNLGAVSSRARSIGLTSLFGIAAPMLAGIACVHAFPRLWGPQALARPGLFALYIGTALSISALPVIARTLMELDLLRHPLGTVVMAAATIDDLLGWALFATILSRFGASEAEAAGPLLVVGKTVAFIAVTLVAGRLLGAPALRLVRRQLPWPGGLLSATVVLVLLASAAAELLGFHAVFGAFFAGVALADRDAEGNEAHATIRRFVGGFFSPLYFVSLGLLADFSHSFAPVLVAVVVALACAGKLGGATLGGRLGGMPARDALAVAFGLNARGAMEMIVASVALQAGIIGAPVFVALIVMALVTSMMSGPAMAALLGLRRIPAKPQVE
ncbi:MAG: cation:proton antiporter [Thermoanaerobaculales bacterium]